MKPGANHNEYLYTLTKERDNTMDRRNFLRVTGATAVAAAAGSSFGAPKPKRPNVLFVAVDDLNDWVGCLGGHPQAITPNLDRFAKQRGVVMSKAYCPSTVCGPTRSALLTGKRAASTGVYGNNQNLKNAPKAKDVVTLPEYFGQHGYHTLSAGKIFHKHPTTEGLDEGQWAYHEHAHPGGKGGVTDVVDLAKVSGIKTGGSPFAWGVVTAKTEETKDYVACKWGADQLERDFDGKPFFMALGVSKPHLAWYVPKEFFDLYPLETFIPPVFRRDDFDDIVNKDGKPIFTPGSRFLAADKAGMHKEAARAYIAAVSYADHCLGVIFDALEKSSVRDDTIVMLWGDHGWHLGEKTRYGKTWLWEESCRVPFIVSAPGVAPSGVKCDGVVNLLDMYPTLIDLCGLPPNPENEGVSFAKLLAKPDMEWKTPTLTTYQYMNHSVSDGRWRYTWYGGKADGAEELYDHDADPMEYKNLASNPEYAPVIARLKKALPKHNEPDSPKNELSGDDKKKMTGGKRKK